MVAESFNAFSQAIFNKLIAEVAATEVKQHAVVGALAQLGQRPQPGATAATKADRVGGLERFPAGVNRDSQGRWNGRIFGSDSPFWGNHEQTFFIGFARTCC